jgi:predicted transporter
MAVEWLGLLLGILFSVGIFAIKSGIGLQYTLSRENPRRVRIGVCVASFCLYGLLFAAAALGLHKADLSTCFHTTQAFLRWGLLLHFIVALLMFSWGIALLRSREVGRTRTLGWLVLVVPCPVCATVVVMSLGLLMAYFPESMFRPALSLYAGFVGLSVLTMLLVKKWGRISAASPEHSLGLAMVTLAAYFLLSVLIMPHFAGLDEVFRLAAHSRRSREVDSLIGWAMAGVQGVLFAAGYLKMRANIRRSTCPTSALF